MCKGSGQDFNLDKGRVQLLSLQDMIYHTLAHRAINILKIPFIHLSHYHPTSLNFSPPHTKNQNHNSTTRLPNHNNTTPLPHHNNTTHRLHHLHRSRDKTAATVPCIRFTRLATPLSKHIIPSLITPLRKCTILPRTSFLAILPYLNHTN